MKNSVKVLGLLAIIAGGCAQAPERLSPQQRQARYHNSLGVVAMDQHNYVRGRDQFETATRLDPAYATAHANLQAQRGYESRFDGWVRKSGFYDGAGTVNLNRTLVQVSTSSPPLRVLPRRLHPGLPSEVVGM